MRKDDVIMKKRIIGGAVMAMAMAGMLSLGCGMPVHAQYNQQEAKEAEEKANEVKQVIPEEKPEAKPFSVAGNGEVLDDISDDETKQFITVRTKNNQTFFVVIDRANSIDNVYMLSMIDEDDLAEFLKDEDEKAGAGGLPEVQIPGDGSVTEDGDAEDVEMDEPEEKTGGSLGTLLFIVGGLGLFAAGYYFFKIKPKKAAEAGKTSVVARQDEDEESDYEDEEYEADEGEDTEGEYEDDRYEEDEDSDEGSDEEADDGAEEEETLEFEFEDEEPVEPEAEDNTEDYYEEEEIEEIKPAKRRRRKRK